MLLSIVSPSGIVSTFPEIILRDVNESMPLNCFSNAGPMKLFVWLYNPSEYFCMSTTCSEPGGIYNFNFSTISEHN